MIASAAALAGPVALARPSQHLSATTRAARQLWTAPSTRRGLRRGSGSTPATPQRSSGVVRSMWLEKALAKVTGNQAGAKSSGPPSTMSFSDNAPSWEELSAMVAAKQAELGVVEPDLENGPTNAKSMTRRFGKAEEPRVILYRDHAAWCPYCQKVWLQLEEKQIPYTVQKINMRCYGDKPPEFLRMVPSGQGPVAKIDGKVVADSAAIQRQLEAMFPERPLLPPPGSSERERADLLNRLERTLFGAWMQWLTSNWGHDSGKASFCKVLDAVETQLSEGGGPYFMGDDISLVDMNFTPFLERMDASLLYYKGLRVRDPKRWPAVCRWFEAMESRPTYIGTRSDYYTHVHDLPPQLGGCAPHPDGAKAAAAIDGTDGESWHLPLAPLRTDSFEPYSPGESPAVDTTEAAAKMVANHAAIARFAARAVGKPGSKPVSAPLSDPTASPGLEHLEAVDAGLRHVVHALMVGPEAKQLSEHALQVDADGKSGLSALHVAASAGYLRDRVGVPRDMNLPAARQLRAHLNWLIDTLEA
mmetsp:Transcript_5968/g.15363  ORF Transcript_5968/g.15363 Transcript_5968/m.15363 type:complete len:531 (+) Transcript_5968:148-1740(+)